MKNFLSKNTTTCVIALLILAGVGYLIYSNCKKTTTTSTTATSEEETPAA